jgi:tetratricopeptide (TPR) repeat protein
LEKLQDQPIRTDSRARLVERVGACLRAGDYSRALDLSRNPEFANDPELSELQKRAQDGLKRKAEADRLITQSQELFAQRKSGEAIQLLRQAYELDKNNSLSRAILANALVEQANSVVETDWLAAEKLANEALKLNPAHPTAKTIQSLIVEQKTNSSVDDWVAQAQKLQSAGDLFAALAWVAEGLAVHPDDPRLLQIQDAIQHDQGARRRQARRGDLDDLRRMQREINQASTPAAKEALAAQIQAVAAKHWTDGEILSIANALLLRLGLVPQGTSPASPHNKGAAVIFHVPRPTAPREVASPIPSTPAPVLAKPLPPNPAPPENGAAAVAPAKVPAPIAAPEKIPAAAAPKPQIPKQQSPVVPAAQPSAPVAKPATVKSAPSRKAKPTSSTSTPLIVACSVAAIILLAASFYFVRNHRATPLANTPATPSSAATASVPSTPEPAASVPDVSSPIAAPPDTTAASSSTPATSSDATAAPDNQPAADAVQNLGTLVIVAGQDGATVSLNGKLQRQLTQAGQLRLTNLAPRDYVVQVSKTGFQDAPPQKIRVRKQEEAKLIFTLQPQPHLASLAIQGGAPGTIVLVDQTVVGTIQPDGTLSVSTVNPGDHIVELRKERFKPRQLKKRFVAGAAISLTAADTALEAAPSELKITFTPADAQVAVAKGDFLKVVSSGVPLNLPAGTYTLTARTAERFTRSATLEVVAGQSKTLDLPLAPTGMSKWDDPGAWKQEKDAFIRKGGDFVLYGVAPASGTFVFSALPKGHVLQWVLNYTDPQNYVLLQIDDKNFYRSVIRNGQKADEIIVPHKGDKKTVRTFQIRVSRTELVHEIKDGERWTVLDRWTQPGANLGAGKFGFYIPGSEQIELSSFAHYADLSLR